MSEPTYEELKAKVAELEKQQARKRSGPLEFRVSEKARSACTEWAAFPSRSITNN